MKKVFAIFTALAILTGLSGCTAANASTSQQANIESTEPTKVATIKDYTITGVSNVTNIKYTTKTQVYENYTSFEPATLEDANSITVDYMCPYCKDESFIGVDFSEIPTSQIGLQTFTWSKEVHCNNWSDPRHDSFTPDEFTISLLFTRNY